LNFLITNTDCAAVATANSQRLCLQHLQSIHIFDITVPWDANINSNNICSSPHLAVHVCTQLCVHNTLQPQVYRLILKTTIFTAQWRHWLSITQINWLTTPTEIIPLYCEHQTIQLIYRLLT
jgi:hypothetical protein